MFPPAGSVDAQGIDIQIGTNCLGSCLLYNLLQPILTNTAASSPAGSVRVAWAASSAVDVMSPKPDGMELDEEGRPKDMGVQLNYGQSKVGNVFLARHFAQATPQTGVLHVSFNPGNLKTELQRHWKGLAPKVTVRTYTSGVFALWGVLELIRCRRSCCFNLRLMAHTLSSGLLCRRT